VHPRQQSLTATVCLEPISLGDASQSVAPLGRMEVFTISIVPEPSTIVAGLGLAVCGLVARRRDKRRHGKLTEPAR